MSLAKMLEVEVKQQAREEDGNTAVPSGAQLGLTIPPLPSPPQMLGCKPTEAAATRSTTSHILLLKLLSFHLPMASGQAW